MTINNDKLSSKRKRIMVVSMVIGLILAVPLFVGMIIWRGNLPYIILRRVPILSGAEIRMDARQSTWLDFYISDGGPMAEILYNIPRPWPEVVEFYKTEMGKQGWKLVKEDSKEIIG